MAKIFVVIDTDNAKGIKAFVNERLADDYAYEYYEKTGIDTRVDEVWFNTIPNDEDDD